jgi:hypothetical protein
MESMSLLVADLGWTPEQAADTRARLASFAEDWDAPGMEGYDDFYGGHLETTEERPV